MADDNTNTTPATNAPVAPTPDANNAQVTVIELFQIVKLLENLNKMGRLSELEIQGIKPAFDKVVAFLAFYEAQVAAQQAATVANIAEVSSEDIDVSAPASAKSKKKAGKKK